MGTKYNAKDVIAAVYYLGNVQSGQNVDRTLYERGRLVLHHAVLRYTFHTPEITPVCPYELEPDSPPVTVQSPRVDKGPLETLWLVDRAKATAAQQSNNGKGKGKK